MDLTQIGAFILKAGSLSGLAAFGWQVWHAYDERRWRLGVETTKYGDTSLSVLISYRPKSQHLGLEARATVIRPSGARLAGLERVPGPENLRMAIAKAVKQVRAEPTGLVKLRHHEGDPDGVFRGDLFVTGLVSEPPAATVKIEVWTVGYPKRIASRSFKLSAVD